MVEPTSVRDAPAYVTGDPPSAIAVSLIVHAAGQPRLFRWSHPDGPVGMYAATRRAIRNCFKRDVLDRRR